MLEAAEHNIIDPSIVSDGAKTLADMRLMITGSAAMPVSVNERWKNLSHHTRTLIIICYARMDWLLLNVNFVLN